MTTLALPRRHRTIPHMGRTARRGGVGLLAAVLAAGAVAGTVKAERATVGHVVPGLGAYAGGAYCQTRDARLTAADNDSTADTITVNFAGDGVRPAEAVTYNMHDGTDIAYIKNAMNGDRVITQVRLCWGGK